MKLDDLDTTKQYIGYDKCGLPFVLAYQPEAMAIWGPPSTWCAIGFERDEIHDQSIRPLVVALRQECAGFIDRVEPLP